MFMMRLIVDFLTLANLSLPAKCPENVAIAKQRYPVQATREAS